MLVQNSFIILAILLAAILNLITPLIGRKNNTPRNLLLILISVYFLINILIADWFFLNNKQASYILFYSSKFSIKFHIEPIGLIFLNLIAILWLCALPYTISYLAINNAGNSSKFIFFMNLCVTLGVLIALAANLFTMFICYEMLTIATIPLIVYEKSDNAWRGLSKYLKILAISSFVLFLPALIIIYNKIGHGDFTATGIIENYFSRNQAIILLLMLMFGISKAALFPLHSWLPAAMVANYPVSALLHAVVVVKAGLICIIKILLYIFGLKYLNMIIGDFNWLVIIPTLTIIYSSIGALGATNIKLILAFSTINQLSIALISAFMLTPKAIAASLLHMISHSFSKICLFYAAGNFYTIRKTYLVKDLNAIYLEMPRNSLFFLVGSLSLIGLPPLGGAVSKFMILFTATEQNLLVVAIISLSTLASATYMTKILITIYKTSSDEKSSQVLEQQLGCFNYLSLYLCMAGIILYYLIYIFIKQFFLFL